MQGSGGGTRRRVVAVLPRANGVIPTGSVWETRMKIDEVKGGVKVFNANDDDRDADEEGLRVSRRLRRNQSDGGGAALQAKKRKNWKATATGPVVISGSSSASASPENGRIQLRKAKSDVPVPRKIIEAIKNGEEVEEVKEMDKGVMEEKAKSVEVEEEVEELDEVEEMEVEEEVIASDEVRMEAEVEEEVKEIDHKAIDEEIAKTPQEMKKASDEKTMDQDTVKPPPQIEKAPLVFDQRTSNCSPEIAKPASEKLFPMSDQRAMNPEPMTPPAVEKKSTPVINRRVVYPEPITPSPEKKSVAGINRRVFKQEPVKPTTVPVSEEVQETTQSMKHGRLQNIVDLVMWRDVSKSAFVFGLGTFLLISTSYARDINLNPISAAAYFALVYLGLIFLYKTILRRGATADCDELDAESYFVDEEDAIWLLRLVLPYVNEVLLKLRSLFSGDPATTMKLALLLFAMARCANFVTVWTLAKLAFFGVFIIPKVCSSYSNQLARYGKFWLTRFRDAWESCTHKKAVAATVFTLVWNVSSTVARVWAVFVLVVAMKYYQQKMADGTWGGEQHMEEELVEDERQEEPPRTRSDQAQEKAQVEAHFPVLKQQQPRLHRGPGPVDGGRERLRVRGGLQPR